MTGYVRGAGMICSRLVFREFLAIQMQTPVPDVHTAGRVLCAYLKIESRRELSTDKHARLRYEALINDFNLWLRAAR